MNYEEVLARIELHDTSNGFWKEVKECVEKCLKCRWHDVRKDRHDLPQDTRDVLIKSHDGYILVGYYDGEHSSWQLYNPDYNFDWDYVDSKTAMVGIFEWREI